jgi:hypothetical protein
MDENQSREANSEHKRRKNENEKKAKIIFHKNLIYSTLTLWWSCFEKKLDKKYKAKKSTKWKFVHSGWFFFIQISDFSFFLFGWFVPIWGFSVISTSQKKKRRTAPTT